MSTQLQRFLIAGVVTASLAVVYYGSQYYYNKNDKDDEN